MRLRALLLVALLPAIAKAHVGSPDVFDEGRAGPYRLLVALSVPPAIPAVVQVSARALDGDVDRVEVFALPATGDGSLNAPRAQMTERSKDDPRYFSGDVWVMTVGSWVVHVIATGPKGKGEMLVPLAATPLITREMPWAIAVLLLAILVLSTTLLVGTIGAAAREATLEAGVMPDPSDRARGRAAMAIALVGLVGILTGGKVWWREHARAATLNEYTPPKLSTTIAGGDLRLRLASSGWLGQPRIDDLVPDHGHMMHLFMVRLPELDRVFHLHPELTTPEELVQHLPNVPKGRYALFADIVHASGLAETAVAELELPELAGVPLAGDDSAGVAPEAQPGRSATLSDGTHLVWDGPASLRAKKLDRLTFHVEGSDAPLEPYMGMMGHAAVLSRDRSVFAHIHPIGSVSMAAIQAVGGQAEHQHEAGTAISFPYAFPKPGAYRMFVQTKRNGRVETAVFDLSVDP
jgi:hypothetical protein